MKKPRLRPHYTKQSRVTGVELHRLRAVADPRGDLAAAEFLKEVPFSPKRFFLIHDVPVSQERGEHAHKQCQQFLVCIAGSLQVEVDNGRQRERFRLHPFKEGVYVPAGVWCSLSRFSRGCVLLVFASHHYDPADYIRDRASYDAWTRLKKR